MKKDKLDALIWEHIPFDNIAFQGATEFKQENLEEIFFDEIDEFSISRDEEYNIKIKCSRKINRFSQARQNKPTVEKEQIPGEPMPVGKIVANLFGNYSIEFNPCYYGGCASTLEKTDYLLNCYHVEGKCAEKKPTVLKEWFLNGSQTGMNFCGNNKFKYTVDGTVSGEYGEMEFPISEMQEEMEYCGHFTHIKFKDTAFDIHFVGNNYGPEWSNNLSISYFEDYGRIPDKAERELIKDYLSFFMGKNLLYIGNSSYDSMGNQIGFEMEEPHTFGFNIRSICINAAKPPIKNDFHSLQTYVETIQNYLEPFCNVYNKLDLPSLFNSFWYAKSIAKPMDLPILAGALEYLKHQWYKEVESNPETVLMDKKAFAKLIGPVKELVEKQFAETQYAARMKRSIDNINRMSVTEQLNHFFDKIGVVIGKSERDALRARNLPAHGNIYGLKDYQKQFEQSQVYEGIICRVVLKLIGYAGDYIDYGTLGYPTKNIDVPGGVNIEIE